MQTTALARHIATTAKDSPRYIVAIAGPPASGKSTLAEQLAALINEQQQEAISAVVPMDGFHLDNDTLDKLGMRQRKGSPATFDAAGFVALISELKAASDDVKIPLFDRTQDAVIPAAQTVTPRQRILLVEGNYLLLNQQPWTQLSSLFDYSVFLNPGIDVLEQRLLQRWLDHGYNVEEARHKAELNDLPNARTVVEQSGKADLVLS